MIKGLCSLLVIVCLITAVVIGVATAADGYVTVLHGWCFLVSCFGAAMGLMMFNYVTQAELELKLVHTEVANLQARGRS